MDPEGRGCCLELGYMSTLSGFTEESPQETGCPAMAALAQSASKRAGGRGAGKGVGMMMTGMACCSAYGL